MKKPQHQSSPESPSTAPLDKRGREALLTEVCELIRSARGLWDQHRNDACRAERQKALSAYEALPEALREKVPQELRVWLRYRSEQYFGPRVGQPQKAPPVAAAEKSATPPKSGLHSRNRFRHGYEFTTLVEASPQLSRHVIQTAYGQPSINYADPEAVKALNQALLSQAYGLNHWDLPPGYLCPPVPGRSDYLHHAADLLSGEHKGKIPRGKAISVLDIGLGANAIYPLVGACEYGWSFVGTDIDAKALEWAQGLISAHPQTKDLITCRLQKASTDTFRGVITDGERFDLTVCNPPFHTSAEEAARGTQRKLKNLSGPATPKSSGLKRNFGGTQGELWCPGGEKDFVHRMILQSEIYGSQCLWFTSLISKAEHLPTLKAAATRAKVKDVRVILMSQGQKQSRFLAWTFITAQDRARWASTRW